MPILDAALVQQLRQLLGLLKSPLELSAWRTDDALGAQVRALLSELADCSPMIQALEEGPGPAGLPGFSIRKQGDSRASISFAGLPLGHEFTSLALALLHASGHPPKISAAAREGALRLKGPLRFETFFSQTCHNCPDVVQALNAIAALNPNVSHVAIDGAAARAEIEARGVMGVPAVFLNGAPFASGRLQIEEILEKLDGSMAQASAAELSKKAPYDMLIVGAGPAGAAAAIYAARKGIRVGVLADRFGGQTLDTQGIENFVSVKETLGPQFAAALEEHARSYAVDVMTPHRAKSLGPAEGGMWRVETESGAELLAKTVVLSTGARWREMNVPGEALYRNKGVAYCPHCDGPLFKGKPVAVVGGGNSGVEAAIDLAGLASAVTLVEYANELKADTILADKLKSLPNVSIVTGARVSEVVGDGSKAQSLRYVDRASDEAREIHVDGIFVQIGLLPNTEWLGGLVEANRIGEILVGPKGETSRQGIFAAGDCTAVAFKQIVIAAGEGAKAALGAFERLMLGPQP